VGRGGARSSSTSTGTLKLKLKLNSDNGGGGGHGTEQGPSSSTSALPPPDLRTSLSLPRLCLLYTAVSTSRWMRSASFSLRSRMYACSWCVGVCWERAVGGGERL
jgi:hypothetical protein